MSHFFFVYVESGVGASLLRSHIECTFLVREKQDHLRADDPELCAASKTATRHQGALKTILEAAMINIIFTYTFLQWALEFPELSSSCIGATYNLENCRHFLAKKKKSRRPEIKRPFFCSGVKRVGKEVCTMCEDAGEE